MSEIRTFPGTKQEENDHKAALDNLTETMVQNEKDAELRRTALQLVVGQGPGLLWADPEQQIEVIQRAFDVAKRFLNVAKNLN